MFNIDKKLSSDMYEFTEKIGDLITIDAHQIIKHRYEIAKNLSNRKISLEVGVGQGYGIQSIAKVASSYTGIEYSIENINYLKKMYSNYTIKHADAHSMPFDSSSFEVVNALAMIYYLDFEIFLKEVERILTLNGTFFFCTSNKDVPGFNESPFTTKYYSIPDLNQILTNYGFEVEFFGSFPKFKYYKRENQLRSMVFIKDIIKSIINILPYGDVLWKKLEIVT
jgi:ubiquinone/menaquinone biosynthesis C-methylase UbiE